MINKTLFILNIFCCSFLHGIPMYFALASDTEFFSKAKRLIESIKKSNGDSLVEIAFFDVGLTQNERDYLKKQDKVKLFDIERTNQFITSQFIVRLDGTKCARGSFSWKPVVLKQCLDMYPYVFYLDSGMRVVGNFTDLFKIVINKGYFLVEAGHSMKGMVIKKVKKFFSIDDNSDFWNKKAIAAGIQGVSRLVYDSYVFPIYKMTSDITLFYTKSIVIYNNYKKINVRKFPS